jgi:hypothetical protein
MKNTLRKLLGAGAFITTLGAGTCVYNNTKSEEFCETYQGYIGPQTFRTFSGKDRTLIFYVFDPLQLGFRQGEPRVSAASEHRLGLNRGSRYCFTVNRHIFDFDMIDENSIRPQ